MHEMGYTRDIIETVIGAAQGAGAHEVRAVYLTIGEIRDIVDELFVKCFDYFSRDTIAAGAHVDIKRIPFMVRCKTCGEVYHIDIHDEATLPCPHCGAQDYGLVSGMEFLIDRVEVA